MKKPRHIVRNKAEPIQGTTALPAKQGKGTEEQAMHAQLSHAEKTPANHAETQHHPSDSREAKTIRRTAAHPHRTMHDPPTFQPGRHQPYREDHVHA